MSPSSDRSSARAQTWSIAGGRSSPWRSRAAITLAAITLGWGAALLAEHASPAQTGRPSGHSATAVAADGRALFLERCGMCHLQGGTGTFMLGRRLGKQHALLADRTDLQIAYVKAVVRNGLNSMPAFTRVGITDQELDAVAEFLAHGRGNAGAAPPP